MGPVHPSLSLPSALAVGISPQTSHILSLLFTTSYVGSLYVARLLLPTSKPDVNKPTGASPQPGISPVSATDDDAQVPLRGRASGPEVGSRDHPDTIRLRMKAVGLATLASLSGVWYVVKNVSGTSPRSSIRPTLALLGLSTSFSSLMSFDILPYILAPVLFLGPIYANYLDGDLPLQQRSSGSWWARSKRFYQSLGLIEIRNYIVGPLTEELVFRSTILAASLLGGLSTRSLIFGTPLWFGVAHAHHALEVWRQGGKTTQAAIQATAGCVFQLTYTTLFGWYASYLFLRTGSVVPPLLSHIFCNIMGIYLPSTAVARHPERKLAVYGAYLAGIMGFTYGLRAL